MPVTADPALSDPCNAAAGLAVIAALRDECRCFDRSMGRFVVLQSGVGPERARLAARRALQQGAAALLSWGLAGGLDRGLFAGDVMVPPRIVTESGASFEVAASWHDDLSRGLASFGPMTGGALLSVGRVLASPELKQAAARRFGAAACDMESAAIAEVALAARRPFAAVRVIADHAEDRLPSGIDAWVNAAGERNLPAVLAALVRPRQWAPLALLARRYRHAGKRLDELSALLTANEFFGPAVRSASM